MARAKGCRWNMSSNERGWIGLEAECTIQSLVQWIRLRIYMRQSCKFEVVGLRFQGTDVCSHVPGSVMQGMSLGSWVTSEMRLHMFPGDTT